MPLVSAFDGGKCVIAVVGFDAVGGEWPWDAGVELFDDLPLGEEGLDFGGVCELKRREQEARRGEVGSRNEKLDGDCHLFHMVCVGTIISRTR